MRTFSISTLSVSLAALLLGSLVATRCQAQESTSNGAKIAIIDVAYIFKNAASIKADVAEIESQMAQLQEFGKSGQSEMVKEAEAIKTFKPGSPEYARQEEKLAGMESSLKLEVMRRRKSLADAEAGLYFANYKRLQQIVAQIAQYNNIDLVLRYDSEGMDIEKPDTVLRSVMKNVVYRTDSIDLTHLVLGAMDKTQIAARQATTKLR